MARHRYSSDKRQKEIKRLKRQEEKRLRRERKGTPEGEQDEQALINGYLGIDPAPESEPIQSEDENPDLQ